MIYLKRIYRASTVKEAESALDGLEPKWEDKYPIVIKSWRGKWKHLSACFKCPEPFRKIMYTTNSIEALHRHFRKLTKTEGGFLNDDSLLKLLYLRIRIKSTKWTMAPHNWSVTLSQLTIIFAMKTFLKHTLLGPTPSAATLIPVRLAHTPQREFWLWFSSDTSNSISNKPIEFLVLRPVP